MYAAIIRSDNKCARQDQPDNTQTRVDHDEPKHYTTYGSFGCCLVAILLTSHHKYDLTNQQN